MKPTHSTPLRVLAWVCVLAVLLAAASPASAGLPPAVLGPLAPAFGEPILCGLARGPEAPVRVDLVVPRGVPARAPPLA